MAAQFAEALLGRFSAQAMRAFTEHAARDDDELLLEWLLERLDRQPSHADTLLAGLRARMTDDTPAGLVQRTNRLVVEMLSPAVERLRDAQVLKIDDVDAFLELIDITFDGMTRRAETDSFVTSWERVANVRRQLLSKQIVSP
ncbi:hypothetical protein [Streptomyces pseudoechinosporeus]